MSRTQKSGKLSCIFVLIILIAGSIIGAVGTNTEASTVILTPNGKGDDFTHGVVLELFVTTWCGYCPSAEAVARQLNGLYGQNFMFVTMICDVNQNHNHRNYGINNTMQFFRLSD